MESAELPLATTHNSDPNAQRENDQRGEAVQSAAGDRPSPKPGRPLALDDVKRAEICALVTAGCGLEHAANFVGCAPNTIRREARRNPEFGESLRFAERQAQLQSIYAIRSAADKHWRAAAWMLDRQIPKWSTRRRPYVMTMRQMGKLLSRLEAILSDKVAWGTRDDIMRRVKAEVIELTELV